MTPSDKITAVLQGMTTEQINVAIAESMGWVKLDKRVPSVVPNGGYYEYQNGDVFRHQLPNYCSDLNACADFERTLTPDESADYYCTHLPDVVGADTDDWMHKQLPKLASATALQRCEAYLRVKELWVEGGAK